MIRKERKGIVWFEFELLKPYPELHHAVFSRVGGTDFLCKQHQDTALDALTGRTPRASIEGFQVHKSSVNAITSHDTPPIIPECDGLATSLTDMALIVKHADCQGAIFYDPVHNAFSCVHAGWRGNVQNIYQKTIETMKTAYGSRPEEILVCISPSLGPEASEFINYKVELPESFWQFQHKPLYFNLWEISRWQLECAGILARHIQIANMCTYSDPVHFFSHRREKPYRGCNATVALLHHT